MTNTVLGIEHFNCARTYNNDNYTEGSEFDVRGENTQSLAELALPSHHHLRP
jgi:hypothetical protein